jgi:divalent metal cation (Fe/Co/Zn/Cd) transporter
MVVNITIGISPELTVARGDEFSTQVEETLICEIDSMRRVFVHYNPVKREN